MSTPASTSTDTSTWTRRLWWMAVLLWSAAIFTVSARPGSTLPGGYSVQGHLGEYFVLGGLLYCALRHNRPEWQAVALALIIASLYGVTDEVHQHFVVMRTPDVTDWGLDTIGAFLGALSALTLTRMVARARLRRETPPAKNPARARG